MPSKKTPNQYSEKWHERNARIGVFSQSVSIDLSADELAENERFLNGHPEYRAALRERHKRAISLSLAYDLNGAGLFVDRYIRSLLSEYNKRILMGNGSKLPTSFNVMNAFTEPASETLILKLLPERVYSLGLDTALDFITDPTSSLDLSTLVDVLDEFTIYELNMIGGYADLRIPGHEKVVFGGAGIVRNHDELSIIGVFGREDPKREGAKVPVEKEKIFPGKEGVFQGRGEIDWDDDVFFDDPSLSPTILLTRIDLGNQRVQARYVMEEKVGGYAVSTDDPGVFEDVRTIRPKDFETYVRNNIERVQEHEGLFNVLTQLSCFVPKLQTMDDDIVVERHPTKIKLGANGAVVRRLKSVLSAAEIPNHVAVQTLIVAGSGGRYTVPSSGLKVEARGYWKTLPLGSVGADKNGQPVQGKTWVEVTKSWFETLGFDEASIGAPVELDIDKSSDPVGYIYVMRTAQHPRDVYKIGFTTRVPDERAAELSAETGQPDFFSVLEAWKVKTPILIEREIHARLANNRLRSGREFFKLKYQAIRKCIVDVIDSRGALLE